MYMKIQYLYRNVTFKKSIENSWSFIFHFIYTIAQMSNSEEAPESVEEQEEEQPQKEAEEKAQGATIHIGNLKWEVDEDGLREAFSKFGEITNVSIPKNNRDQSRGFGFVTYATQEAADAAIKEMDNADLQGREIKVSISHPHEHNDRDRRGDRRGGRYNDRDGGNRRRDRDDRDRRGRGDRRDRDRGDRGGYGW